MLTPLNKYNSYKAIKHTVFVETATHIKYITKYYSLLFRRQFFRTLLNNLNHFYQNFDLSVGNNNFYTNKFILTFYSVGSAGFYPKKILFK